LFLSLFVVTAGQKAEGRLAICPGHPRLSPFLLGKAWMPGMKPGMTG